MLGLNFVCMCLCLLQFPQLCKQPEFLGLPVDKLVEIVSDDDLNVTMEESVYEACMAWLEEDVDGRKGSLVEVRSMERYEFS